MFEYTEEERARLLSGDIAITKKELKLFIGDGEDIRFVDTSKITDMSNLFGWSHEDYTELDLSRWNMSNVKNAKNMFRHCGSKKINAKNWDLSKLENAETMFYGLERLKELNTENWKLHNLKNASGMFSRCRSLKELNTENWNLHNLKNASSMFSRCRSLKELVVENWDLSNLEEASDMFGACIKLKELNTKNWNLLNLKNASRMFDYCHSLKALKLNKIPNEINFEFIFQRCFSLELETKSSCLLKEFKKNKEEVEDKKKGYIGADTAELFLSDIDGLSFKKVKDTKELECFSFGYKGDLLFDKENGVIIELNENHIEIIEDNQLLSEKSTVKKEENKPKRNRLKR